MEDSTASAASTVTTAAESVEDSTASAASTAMTAAESVEDFTLHLKRKKVTEEASTTAMITATAPFVHVKTAEKSLIVQKLVQDSALSISKSQLIQKQKFA